MVIFRLAVGALALLEPYRQEPLTSEIVNTRGQVGELYLNHADYAIPQYRLYNCVRLFAHHAGDRATGWKRHQGHA